jgi:alkanesulfonate monooxygenase SsuD/methylene tetrahydromethanopterin reductase-like flavin-dependent oxidoreductase (luciferase family)
MKELVEMATQHIAFGYNPPSGDRGIETIDGATYVRDLHEVCDLASQHFDTFWISDHFMRGDTFRMECWTHLTWLAARYPTQTLGTVVIGNSYRHPPLLAKMAASLQAFSRGRLIMGYGAGWLEDEYRAYGYEFPSARVRIAQMVEGIEVMKAMWTERPANYHGTYYQVANAYCEPMPDPVPPVMIGGDGEKYLLRAVAEHGDWWLTYSRGTDVIQHKMDVLQQHCTDVGRDYATIRKVYPMTVYLADSRAAAERQAGSKTESDSPPFVGEPAALVERIQEMSGLGFDHFALSFAGWSDTTDMRLFIDKVLPAFR